ncbi:MFS transporter [Agrobacterium rhizogenes]|nr:MFS transporter [Agrobacterium sp. ICMP 7243]NTF50863.1 MFS transporter [Rhizobium rhizogenes]NTF57554.1 MFS transporter [Rhizobium rhizogenes]NTF77136.1 MFS transporter [Rhizobium rhizogenes]NTF95873.1 MFS transporter [Rhizobium rhizogenes]
MMTTVPSVLRFPSPAAVFIAVGGLYIAQSVIGGVIMLGLPAVLRAQGLPLDQIGLLYLTVIPWALKFLWSPYVERFRLPAQGHNRSRLIVFAGGLLCAAGLAAIGLTGPYPLAPVLCVLLLVALVTSTVDIACDGYAVETLAKEHHGWGNTAQVGGSYLGSAIGAGLFLVLVDSIGWSYAAFAMASLVIILGLPFVFGPATRGTIETRPHAPSLLLALKRPQVQKGLMIAAIYVAGQKWGLSMLGPFLIDRGLDLATIGALNGIGSMVVGFSGALLGGLLVRLWGATAVLILAILLQAALLAGLALFSFDDSLPRVFIMPIAIASSSGVMSVGFVALYSQFMGWSDPKQAGVDFTLFQCADGLISMAGGLGAGWIAEHLGYAVFFTVAAIIAVLAVPAIGLLMRGANGNAVAIVRPADGL